MAKETILQTEGLCKEVANCIRNAYDRGYKQGYKDGEDIEQSNAAVTKEEVTKIEYERGLNDAWAYAHKIAGSVDKGGLPYYALFEIFGHNSAIANIFTDYSPSECIQKIKEYEQKHNDEIKIGDEVITPAGHKGVIVYTNQYQGTAMLPDGSIRAFLKTEYKKTGKTFPQITEIFNDLKGESND